MLGVVGISVHVGIKGMSRPSSTLFSQLSRRVHVTSVTDLVFETLCVTTQGTRQRSWILVRPVYLP